MLCWGHNRPIFRRHIHLSVIFIWHFFVAALILLWLTDSNTNIWDMNKADMFLIKNSYRSMNHPIPQMLQHKHIYHVRHLWCEAVMMRFYSIMVYLLFSTLPKVQIMTKNVCCIFFDIHVLCNNYTVQTTLLVYVVELYRRRHRFYFE